MYQVPTGSEFYGSANNGDQTTFTLPGHTVSTPHLMIFDRKVPVSNGNGYTTPSIRVRVIRGFEDTEGNPLSARAVVDATIRWPLEGPEADVKSMVQQLADVFASTAFQDSAIDKQTLPREVASA